MTQTTAKPNLFSIMFNRLFGITQPPKYEPQPTKQEDAPTPLVSATGTLFINEKNPDGSNNQKIMYLSCTAQVRPASSSHDFQLVVTREDEPDHDDTYPTQTIFAVNKAARFESSEASCGWSGGDAKRYNFDIDENEDIAAFAAILGVSLFQHIYKKEPGVDDAQTIKSLLDPQPDPDLEKPSDELIVTAGELTKVEGELYQYRIDPGSFELVVPSVNVIIKSAVRKDDNTRAYVVDVTLPNGEQFIECELDNTMNTQFFMHTLSVVWVLNLNGESTKDTVEVDPETQLCFSVKMRNAESFVSFRNQFSVCLYEVNHQASMEDLKLKEYDREYVARSDWDDVEPMEVDSGSEADEAADVRTIREEVPRDRASMQDSDDGVQNSHLAVSANTDRTFVVRGNKMGVFQTGLDGAKFKTSIKFKDPSNQGNAFVPSNILLHEQDRSMIVLDKTDPTKLMRMDLERGEIVDTWRGPMTQNTPVKTVHRVSKYSNLTATKEFVGLNSSALLRMDPRTREFIVQSKKYAAGTRAKLGCVATTGAGHLAVASETGDIRLYDTIGKNAKTHLPGLGDPIMGIDVSEDGKYVLATTKKYLLIINTQVKEHKQPSGFLRSMGKHKPAPRKLVIKPQDIVKHRMGEINFTPAHFNTGNSLERSIVTSSGPFLITWSFRSVKLGRLDTYKIAKYQDEVVADDFTFNNDGKIVVTLPNDVSIATRR